MKYYSLDIDPYEKAKYSTSEVGNKLGTGRNKLRKFLQILGILIGTDDYNPLFNDWFIIDNTSNPNGYGQQTVRITSLGYVKIIKLVEKVGLVNVASISMKNDYNEQALKEVVDKALK